MYQGQYFPKGSSVGKFDAVTGHITGFLNGMKSEVRIGGEHRSGVWFLRAK